MIKRARADGSEEKHHLEKYLEMIRSEVEYMNRIARVRRKKSFIRKGFKVVLCDYLGGEVSLAWLGHKPATLGTRVQSLTFN